jgi:hypothetical protein
MKTPHQRMLELKGRAKWFRQGQMAAESDFGWCSMQVRKKNSEYSCSDCIYETSSNAYFAFHEGYKTYWDKRNAQPRKNQVPLPDFYRVRKGRLAASVMDRLSRQRRGY